MSGDPLKAPQPARHAPPPRADDPNLIDAARRAYLALGRLEQAEFWRWIRSGEADEEASHA